MRTLKERLKDWMSWDGAAYELGVVLGLWPEFGTDPNDHWCGQKGTMWSNTLIGSGLSRTLSQLVGAGICESRNGYQEYRWKPTEETTTT